MNLNKAIIIGRLTRDPELKALPNGTSVCNFSIATNRNWTDKQGEKKQKVEFHNIVAFAKTADLVNTFLFKGSEALIEGRIQTRSWEGKTGGKQYRTEIVAESVQFGAKPSNQDRSQESQAETQSTPETTTELPSEPTGEDFTEQDLPF